MKAIRKRNERVIKSLERLSNFGNINIEVGWIQAGQKHRKTDLNMAQLAYVLMHGATITNKKTGSIVKIPPRPIFDVVVKKKGNEWVKEAQQLAQEILVGKIGDAEAKEVLGALMADDIKGVMNDKKNWIPNAPSTARRKGKNTPLIDTGELRDAIDYIAQEKGKRYV